ncbi:hypothetical protein ABC977_02360 [Thioalkalicoccus limnaeus]|uniref:DUF3558 domain-containing protein n=1 Tax=Thioalkalicoccus limnaeus TaxID=120681 RepID=A0ABV4BA13_9GAMM
MLPVSDRPRSLMAGFRLLFLSLLAGTLFAPSGAAHAEPPAAQPVDACALLTQADIEEVFAAAVGAPTPKSVGRGPFWVSMCHYDNAHTEAPMLSVGFLVKAHGAADPAQAYTDYVAELRRELGELAAPASVEGLAGPAGWDAATGQLTLFAGPYQVILTTLGRYSGDRLDLAKQIAERVPGRLPKP